MLALILAGGSGTRLNRGEKPLVDICGQPMIWYIIRAVRAFGTEPFVVLSRQTPYTGNWCRVNRVNHIIAQTGDFMGDIIETVQGLDETGPVLISACDLPAVDAAILHIIENAYHDSSLPALSTWVPTSLCERTGCSGEYSELVNGTHATPAGINILSGDRIGEPQAEYRLLIDDWKIALNVNTPLALDTARRMIARRSY